MTIREKIIRLLGGYSGNDFTGLASAWHDSQKIVRTEHAIRTIKAGFKARKEDFDKYGPTGCIKEELAYKIANKMIENNLLIYACTGPTDENPFVDMSAVALIVDPEGESYE